MTVPPWSGQAGDRSTRRPGEVGGAADVLKAASIVVPAEQQRAGIGRGAVTAPTIASLVSRILYFCQPLTEAR
ncbi:hypothetical protein [Streptomyces sp. NPDC005859]|uniref:hypothetical protein n=1 Tax=Streptomyces sp. NPDC005859 TaxID=3157170 RepID=UPI00340FC7EC